MIGKIGRNTVRANMLLAVFSLLIAGFLAILSWQIYGAPELFYTKVADLVLQLGVIVVIGSVAKLLIDWAANENARQRQKLENMLDFMKRVRSMHLEIHYAKDLLNAHRSGRTYVERMKRLILLRGEIGEVIEDLKATENLFESQSTIIQSLEEIIRYLNIGRDEYVNCYKHVNSDAKDGKPIDETIKSQNMRWLNELMNGSGSYEETYLECLSKSKGAMRVEVYGA